MLRFQRFQFCCGITLLSVYLRVTGYLTLPIPGHCDLLTFCRRPSTGTCQADWQRHSWTSTVPTTRMRFRHFRHGLDAVLRMLSSCYTSAFVGLSRLPAGSHFGSSRWHVHVKMPPAMISNAWFHAMILAFSTDLKKLHRFPSIGGTLWSPMMIY